MAGCGWPTFARRSRASLWRIWWRRWWVQRVMCDECTDGRQHEKKQTYSVCQSPVRFEVWSILPVMFSGAGRGSTWGENVSRLSCFHMRVGTFPVSFVPVNGLNLHHGKSDLQICIWMIITTQIIPHVQKKKRSKFSSMNLSHCSCFFYWADGITERSPRQRLTTFWWQVPSIFSLDLIRLWWIIKIKFPKSNLLVLLPLRSKSAKCAVFWSDHRTTPLETTPCSFAPMKTSKGSRSPPPPTISTWWEGGTTTGTSVLYNNLVKGL